MRFWVIGSTTLLLASCGGEVEPGPALEIGFIQQGLECTAPGMQARLEATGVVGACPLQVSADHRVTGVCREVPAGDVRNFRLVYYYDIGRGPEPEVELAVVTAALDLRDQREPTVVLEFPANRLIKDQNDDNDSFTNLQEFCAGTDPRMAD